MLLVVDNLLLYHVGLPQVVIVAVHLVIFLLDHPETCLLKALCCQSAPSWLKLGMVVVGGWPVRLYCHLLGLGVGLLSIFIPTTQSLDNIIKSRESHEGMMHIA